MAIVYAVNEKPSADEFAALLRASEFNRPIEDPSRVEAMIGNADAFVTAREDGVLVGVVRGLSDFACYALVTELAVAVGYKRRGIGRELLRLFRERVGDECAVILHSSEEGHAFYGRLGWDLLVRAWRLPRAR